MRSHSTPWPALEAAPPSRRGVYLKTLFFSLFSIAFVLGGLYFGLIFLRNLSLIVAASAPAGIAARFEPLAAARGVPVPRSDGNTPIWEEHERITVLLLGIDQRPWEINEPSRTDTILLATYDPHTKTAGMLSIPRDLWIPIPISRTEVIEDRINTAHLYGDLYKYPGGGPALAKATIEYNFGVKVNYVAGIDFEGFEKVIDMVGGITVDVPSALKDDEYPTPDYGTERIYFPAGLQHLDGERALKYARTRHADSDLGRIRRQQQVLLAFREQALRLNLLPQAPALIAQLGSSVRSDVSLADLVPLAREIQEVDTQNIMSRSLAPPVVEPTITVSGAEIMIPKRSEVAKIIRELFFDGRLKKESATVEVVNASNLNGLAAQAGQVLQRQGVTARVSTSSEGVPANPAKTEILDASDKPYTAGYLADLLKIDRSAIRKVKAGPDGSADIRLILGRDATIPTIRE